MITESNLDFAVLEQMDWEETYPCEWLTHNTWHIPEQMATYYLSIGCPSCHREKSLLTCLSGYENAKNHHLRCPTERGGCGALIKPIVKILDVLV